MLGFDCGHCIFAMRFRCLTDSSLSSYTLQWKDFTTKGSRVRNASLTRLALVDGDYCRTLLYRSDSTDYVDLQCKSGPHQRKLWIPKPRSEFWFLSRLPDDSRCTVCSRGSDLRICGEHGQSLSGSRNCMIDLLWGAWICRKLPRIIKILRTSNNSVSLGRKILVSQFVESLL